MWPDGKKCAMVISFDFDAEEVWLSEHPNNVNRPGVLSQGTYGAKVGVGLILDLLKELDLPATFFVPGRVAENHPERVKQIVAAGHELGHHGYTHTSPVKLSAAEEEAELIKGREVLESFGAKVVGYRSPSWEVTPHTFDLLTKYGFEYSSSMMDDITIYRHANHPIVELPVHWILDDAPHFWFDSGATWNKTMRTPEEVEQLWQGEFTGIRELGGMIMLTMHPQIIGRPGRLAMLKRFLTWAKSHDDVWFAQAQEVAKRA
jgi:peptidoglycan/xylan/chitin deacetylase (PgdA/CDA1 family)